MNQKKEVFDLVLPFINVPDLTNIIVKYAVPTPVEDFIEAHKKLIGELDCSTSDAKPWKQLIYAIVVLDDYDIANDFFKWLCEVHFLNHMTNWSARYDAQPSLKKAQASCSIMGLKFLRDNGYSEQAVSNHIQTISSNFVKRLFYGKKMEQLYDKFILNYIPTTTKTPLSIFYVQVAEYITNGPTEHKIMLTQAPNVESTKYNFLCDVRKKCMSSQSPHECFYRMMKQILAGPKKLELCEETQVDTITLAHI